MELLFPPEDHVRFEFKDCALNIGFDDLAAECTANIVLLQPHDRLSVLLMAWKKIGDYLTKNQYAPFVGKAVNWVGRYTLDLWFGRDWVACSGENKTSLIEHMMKVYPAAFITMHPFSWPYMFANYHDPWMVEYLNDNFQRMNGPDMSEVLESKDSEFIQQEGIMLIMLRMVKMFEFKMTNLIKHLCLRILLAWQDVTSSANRGMRNTPGSAQYINYVRHIYLIAICESTGPKDLHYVLEGIQRNQLCNTLETGPLETAAQIIAKGLQESNKTLMEFLNDFLLNVPERIFNNLFGSAIYKYTACLTEYQLRKLHSLSSNKFLKSDVEDDTYERLVKMFIRQRESTEDLMKTTAMVSERLFAGVYNLKALKSCYKYIKQRTRSEWYSTKITLLFSIINEELNSLEEFKYTDEEVLEDLITKEQELAIFYRDLAKLLTKTPYLEQEAWLTTFSLHPCKEYMEAVTKCGSRNLRAIKKQAQKFKLLPITSTKKPEEQKTDVIKEEATNSHQTYPLGTTVQEAELPSTSAAFLATLAPGVNLNEIKEPIKSLRPHIITKKKLTGKKPGPNLTNRKTIKTITKQGRGRPAGKVNSKKLTEKNPGRSAKDANLKNLNKKLAIVKENDKDKDTAEVLYAAAAGASDSLPTCTAESLNHPAFALMNSVTDTEVLIKYTDYDDKSTQYKELNRILSNLKLPNSNYDDVLSLLISPRYKRLTWSICWKVLRKRCRELLTKNKKKSELVQQYMANANDRLTHLNIDYEKYKNNPQIDYGTIEGGYECFDTDSEEDTLKPVVADFKELKEKQTTTNKRTKKRVQLKGASIKNSKENKVDICQVSLKVSLKATSNENSNENEVKAPIENLRVLEVLSQRNLSTPSLQDTENYASSAGLSPPVFLDRPVYIVRKSTDMANNIAQPLNGNAKVIENILVTSPNIPSTLNINTEEMAYSPNIQYFDNTVSTTDEGTSRRPSRQSLTGEETLTSDSFEENCKITNGEDNTEISATISKKIKPYTQPSNNSSSKEQQLGLATSCCLQLQLDMASYALAKECSHVNQEEPKDSLSNKSPPQTDIPCMMPPKENLISTIQQQEPHTNTHEFSSPIMRVEKHKTEKTFYSPYEIQTYNKRKLNAPTKIMDFHTNPLHPVVDAGTKFYPPASSSTYKNLDDQPEDLTMPKITSSMQTLVKEIPKILPLNLKTTKPTESDLGISSDKYKNANLNTPEEVSEKSNLQENISKDQKTYPTDYKLKPTKKEKYALNCNVGYLQQELKKVIEHNVPKPVLEVSLDMAAGKAIQNPTTTKNNVGSKEVQNATKTKAYQENPSTEKTQVGGKKIKNIPITKNDIDNKETQNFTTTNNYVGGNEMHNSAENYLVELGIITDGKKIQNISTEIPKSLQLQIAIERTVPPKLNKMSSSQHIEDNHTFEESTLDDLRQETEVYKDIQNLSTKTSQCLEYEQTKLRSFLTLPLIKTSQPLGNKETIDNSTLNPILDDLNQVTESYKQKHNYSTKTSQPVKHTQTIDNLILEPILDDLHQETDDYESAKNLLTITSQPLEQEQITEDSIMKSISPKTYQPTEHRETTGNSIPKRILNASNQVTEGYEDVQIFSTNRYQPLEHEQTIEDSIMKSISTNMSQSLDYRQTIDDSILKPILDVLHQETEGYKDVQNLSIKTSAEHKKITKRKLSKSMIDDLRAITEGKEIQNDDQESSTPMETSEHLSLDNDFIQELEKALSIVGDKEDLQTKIDGNDFEITTTNSLLEKLKDFENIDATWEEKDPNSDPLQQESENEDDNVNSWEALTCSPSMISSTMLPLSDLIPKSKGASEIEKLPWPSSIVLGPSLENASDSEGQSQPGIFEDPFVTDSPCDLMENSTNIQEQDSVIDPTIEIVGSQYTAITKCAKAFETKGNNRPVEKGNFEKTGDITVTDIIDARRISLPVGGASSIVKEKSSAAKASADTVKFQNPEASDLKNISTPKSLELKAPQWINFAENKHLTLDSNIDHITYNSLFPPKQKTGTTKKINPSDGGYDSPINLLSSKLRKTTTASSSDSESKPSCSRQKKNRTRRMRSARVASTSKDMRCENRQDDILHDKNKVFNNNLLDPHLKTYRKYKIISSGTDNLKSSIQMTLEALSKDTQINEPNTLCQDTTSQIEKSPLTLSSFSVDTSDDSRESVSTVREVKKSKQSTCPEGQKETLSTSQGARQASCSSSPEGRKESNSTFEQGLKKSCSISKELQEEARFTSQAGRKESRSPSKGGQKERRSAFQGEREESCLTSQRLEQEPRTTSQEVIKESRLTSWEGQKISCEDSENLLSIHLETNKSRRSKKKAIKKSQSKPSEANSSASLQFRARVDLSIELDNKKSNCDAITGRMDKTESSSEPLSKEKVDRTGKVESSSEPMDQEEADRRDKNELSSEPMDQEESDKSEYNSEPMAKVKASKTDNTESSSEPLSKEVSNLSNKMKTSLEQFKSEVTDRIDNTESSSEALDKEVADALNKMMTDYLDEITNSDIELDLESHLFKGPENFKKTAAKNLLNIESYSPEKYFSIMRARSAAFKLAYNLERKRVIIDLKMQDINDASNDKDDTVSILMSRINEQDDAAGIISLFQEQPIFEELRISAQAMPIESTEESLMKTRVPPALLSSIYKVTLKGTIPKHNDFRTEDCEACREELDIHEDSKSYKNELSISKTLRAFANFRHRAMSPTFYSPPISIKNLSKEIKENQKKVPVTQSIKLEMKGPTSPKEPPVRRPSINLRHSAKLYTVAENIQERRASVRISIRNQPSGQNIDPTRCKTPVTLKPQLIEDTDEDSVEECVTPSTEIDSEKDAGSDYAPKSRQQKLVEPMKLRSIGRRFVTVHPINESYLMRTSMSSNCRPIDSANESSSCSGTYPAVVTRQLAAKSYLRRVSTNSNYLYTRRNAGTRRINKQLSALERAALLRYNCMELEVRVFRLTIRDVKNCRQPFVRLKRFEIEQYLKEHPLSTADKIEQIETEDKLGETEQNCELEEETEKKDQSEKETEQKDHLKGKTGPLEDKTEQKDDLGNETEQKGDLEGETEVLEGKTEQKDDFEGETKQTVGLEGETEQRDDSKKETEQKEVLKEKFKYKDDFEETSRIANEADDESESMEEDDDEGETNSEQTFLLKKCKSASEGIREENEGEEIINKSEAYYYHRENKEISEEEPKSEYETDQEEDDIENEGKNLNEEETDDEEQLENEDLIEYEQLITPLQISLQGTNRISKDTPNSESSISDEESDDPLTEVPLTDGTDGDDDNDDDDDNTPNAPAIGSYAVLNNAPGNVSSASFANGSSNTAANFPTNFNNATLNITPTIFTTTFANMFSNTATITSVTSPYNTSAQSAYIFSTSLTNSPPTVCSIISAASTRDSYTLSPKILPGGCANSCTSFTNISPEVPTNCSCALRNACCSVSCTSSPYVSPTYFSGAFNNAGFTSRTNITSIASAYDSPITSVNISSAISNFSDIMATTCRGNTSSTLLAEGLSNASRHRAFDTSPNILSSYPNTSMNFPTEHDTDNNFQHQGRICLCGYPCVCFDEPNYDTKRDFEAEIITPRYISRFYIVQPFYLPRQYALDEIVVISPDRQSMVRLPVGSDGINLIMAHGSQITVIMPPNYINNITDNPENSKVVTPFLIKPCAPGQNNSLAINIISKHVAVDLSTKRLIESASATQSSSSVMNTAVSEIISAPTRTSAAMVNNPFQPFSTRASTQAGDFISPNSGPRRFRQPFETAVSGPKQALNSLPGLQSVRELRSYDPSRPLAQSISSMPSKSNEIVKDQLGPQSKNIFTRSPPNYRRHRQPTNRRTSQQRYRSKYERNSHPLRRIQLSSLSKSVPASLELSSHYINSNRSRMKHKNDVDQQYKREEMEMVFGQSVIQSTCFSSSKHTNGFKTERGNNRNTEYAKERVEKGFEHSATCGSLESPSKPTNATELERNDNDHKYALRGGKSDFISSTPCESSQLARCSPSNSTKVFKLGRDNNSDHEEAFGRSGTCASFQSACSSPSKYTSGSKSRRGNRSDNEFARKRVENRYGHSTLCAYSQTARSSSITSTNGSKTEDSANEHVKERI